MILSTHNKSKRIANLIFLVTLVCLLYATAISALAKKLFPGRYYGLKNLMARQGKGMTKGEVAGAAIGGVGGTFVLVGIAACCFARCMR